MIDFSEEIRYENPENSVSDLLDFKMSWEMPEAGLPCWSQLWRSQILPCICKNYGYGTADTRYETNVSEENSPFLPFLVTCVAVLFHNNH